MKHSFRVLIAEDEYLNLMGLKSSVENLGHKVIGEASDGKEAIKLALELKPDLILMDINMPIIDGIEAIKEINKEIVLPVIIISGYHDRELISKAREAGVFAYLIKPVREKDLQAAIEICLARFNQYKDLEKEYNSIKERLEARKYIERAKGILMERNGLKESEAMKALQKKSRDSNRKIVDIAREIIEADNILRM